MKAKSEFLSSSLATNDRICPSSLLILFLPTQFGKHFWPNFSLVSGIRIDYLSPTLYFTDILIGLLFVVVIARNVMTKQSRGASVSTTGLPRFARNDSVIPLLVLIFLVINVLSSDRIGLSAYYLLKFAEFSFLTYYIAQTFRSRFQLTFAALLLSVGAFFESFLSILQFLNQGSLNGWLYYLGERAFTAGTPGIANASINGDLILRPYGTFPHPNVLAGYLLIVSLIIVFFLLKHAKGFVRYFAFAVLLLSGIALVLTLSRIAILLWIILMAGLGIGWLLKHIRSIQGMVIVFGFIGLLFAMAFTLPFTQTIIDRFTSSSFTEEAFLQRSDLIAHSLTMMHSNPLIGVGLGNFIPSLAPLMPMLSPGTTLQPVHNIFLLTGAEVGLIGLTLFITFIAATYRRVMKQTLINTGSLLVLLSVIMIIGLFDHYWLTLQQGQLLFAFVLGLCWIKVRDYKESDVDQG